MPKSDKKRVLQSVQVREKKSKECHHHYSKDVTCHRQHIHSEVQLISYSLNEDLSNLWFDSIGEVSYNLLSILTKYSPNKEKLKQLEETAPTLYQEIFHLFAERCKGFFPKQSDFNNLSLSKHLRYEKAFVF